MNKLKTLLLTSLITVTGSVLASPVTSVTEISEEWRQNFNSGSKDALMKLYSDEAVLFQPNNEIVDGTEAINDYLNRLNYLNVEDFIIWDVEMDSNGKVAYETALWQATGIDANGQTVSYDVNVTNVLEKQADGSWKIRMQSWN
ncbi:MAG: DUF4440 domain-containing protein [Gammaproteobacteria bacterium]